MVEAWLEVMLEVGEKLDEGLVIFKDWNKGLVRGWCQARGSPLSITLLCILGQSTHTAKGSWCGLLCGWSVSWCFWLC